MSKLSRMRKSLIPGGLQLSENSKAQLRSRRIEFRLTQPIGQPVPSGENLGHHLQVVDSKRLKFATHSVDRTAVGYGAAARLQIALCSGSLNRCVPCLVRALSWATTLAPAEALRPGGIDGYRRANAEGARLENEAGERHQATPKTVNAHAKNDFTFSNYHVMCARKPRCSSRF